MLPRALFMSAYPTDAILETVAVGLVAGAAIWMVEIQRQEQLRREQTLAEIEALSFISTAAAQSLDLQEVLLKSLEKITEVLQADIGWVYLLDEETKELHFAGDYGMPEALREGADRLALGEGLNGRVAETGEPIALPDLSADPRLTREAVRQCEVRGFMAAPLRCRGVIIGTVGVGKFTVHRFTPDQLRLLSTIGNQIGVMVENARLYRRTVTYMEQLAASEEAYRTLFENASDAIVLLDFGGNIVAANKSFGRLTGYSHDELVGRSIATLMPEKSEARLLDRDRPNGEPWQTRLLTKDGQTKLIEVAASFITEGGEHKGLQFIARDITERQQVHENLRWYVREITRAQEEERMRIARELHDDTTQVLVFLSRRLSALDEFRADAPPELMERVKEAREMLESVLRGVRRITRDLRPSTLDHLGLVPALRGWLAGFLADAETSPRLEVVGEVDRLPPEVELALFRIVQEALNNARRHSGASEVTVWVEFGKQEVSVCIRDNGKGFTVPKRVGDLAREAKLGLLGMYERASLIGGKLEIRSEPGCGTQVIVKVPKANGVLS